VARGLQLFDRGITSGLVLLCRLDYLQSDERAEVLDRATWEVRCNWRPIWIPGTLSGRWSFHWIIWLHEPRRPPMIRRLRHLTQLPLPFD
jgi:hypothetical protein